MSMRLGILGCGHHCRSFHVPALADWMAAHPDEAAVVALCDSDAERSGAAQAVLGGALIDDWQQLLAMDLDGLLAITPPAFTPTVVGACAAAGLPVLMEKPLATSLAAAEALVAEMGDAPHMVSMNRRYDPALRRGRAWIGERAIGHVHATFARVDRREPQFIEETGIHIVDAVASLVGPLTWAAGDRWQHNGVSHYRFRASGRTSATFEILPAGGIDQEAIVCCGDGWRLEIRSAWFDTGTVRAWLGKDLVLDERIADDLPAWQRAGVDAETAAFLAAIAGQSAFAPLATDVLPSARVCAAAAGLECCMQ